MGHKTSCLKTCKVLLLVFAVFLLISFAVSAPAKMKRLALTPEWSAGVDSAVGLALGADIPNVGTPQIAGLVSQPKGDTIISRVITSKDIYRGPPALFL